VAVLAAAGAFGWLKAKVELQAGLDRRAQALRAEGYVLSWTAERIDGFPFRLDLTLDQPRFADRTGWALAAPQIKGEAYAYAPDRWIFVAPQGFALTRPGKGTLQATGQAIRASVSGLGSATPRLSFQGIKLTFTPSPSSAPPLVASADLLEMHLQPGPDDQAALLVKLDGGRSLTGANNALQILWHSRLSRLSQISGPDWPSAVRHWISAGGVLSVDQAELDLGGLKLNAMPTPLTVGMDGHLQGALAVSVAPGKRTAMLNFQNGLTTLGPVVLGPAPRVF
jgi:hypothetical protein